MRKSTVVILNQLNIKKIIKSTKIILENKKNHKKMKKKPCGEIP